MPKLRRFVHHDKHIHYVRELGAGGEGVVHLVIIEGKGYAMKLFLPWEWQQVGFDLEERWRIFTSPFARECRAFARLQSIGEGGTWAVKCHGWMKLTDEQSRPVASRYGQPQGRWAIIKDYLPDPVQLSDCQELIRKKHIQRRAMIFTLDIQPRNFRGSFLVDLGSAITYPCVYWSKAAFEDEYEVYDRQVTSWEVDEETGEVVHGGTNAHRRKRRRRAERLRTAQTDPALGYVPALPEDKETD